jgi:hypothetical protein
LYRNWSFTAFAWWLVSIPWNWNRKKEEAPAMPSPLIVKAQWTISDPRHQLKRQTSDEVTVWTNFSEWIKSPLTGTPPTKS